jgi:hypothetical protein
MPAAAELDMEDFITMGVADVVEVAPRPSSTSTGDSVFAT